MVGRVCVGALLTRAMTRIAERDGRSQPGQCQVGSDVTLHLWTDWISTTLLVNIDTLSRTDNPHRKKNNSLGSQTCKSQTEEARW